MYKFIPQKKRSRLRIKIGCIFYTLKRYFYWIFFYKLFAKQNKKTFADEELLLKEYPQIVFSHSTPLYRKLSLDEQKFQEAKVQNILIAIKKLNMTLVKQNKIFSYWKLIGNPTKNKGYQKGMVLVNGKPSEGTGGGLCAISNLIYWMTLHTPLTVLERWRHSYDVFPDSNRTQPFGSGATCVYNFRDLMIQNNTNQNYLLHIWVENNRLCGEWRSKKMPDESYKVFQKEHWITMEGQGIYIRHNTIWRTCTNLSTKESFDEFVTENHALMMYRPFLEDNKNQGNKNEY